MTSELSVSTAKAPFDRIDADVILLSSDNVEFWVFKVILSLSSPVFESMFGANGSKTSRSDTPAPTFKVPESSITLETLLRLIYPTTTPTLQSYDDAKAFLGAVAKYKVSNIVLRHAKQLVAAKYMEEHFMSIYALSCRYRWKDLALAAARESLRVDVLHDTIPYTEEMEEMTAACYHRLLLYHRACGIAAHDVHSNEEWSPYQDTGLYSSSSCDKCGCNNGENSIYKYMTACEAVLLRQPSPSTILDAEIPEEVAETWFKGQSKACQHRPQRFLEFRSAFAAEVERLISEVGTLPARRASYTAESGITQVELEFP
ncbi:hypothetical protein F5141DRAFT_1245699 [Pisolithus sp. B1]|nr:hypothetical protein F5141DRAFT_1245699 [Pisolithus sp. B1]